MAVVGSAFVVIRAIAPKMRQQIQTSLKPAAKLGQEAGKAISDGIGKGFGNAALNAFDNLSERLEISRLQFRRLSNAGRFLGTALVGLVGGIGAIGGGLIVLASAASQASRSLVVLPAVFGALIQALGTTRFLLGGVSEAFQAKVNAQKQSGAANNAEAASLRRLRDARLALKRLIEEEAPAELEAARERAADAARAAAGALLSAERSQRSYNDAQRATQEALEDLNDARDTAREKLQQLRFEVEGAAISEARARLEFEKARDSLQAVQDLPPNSRARQEAELAFAEAELNLRKAIDSNADLKKEEEAASRAGIEGSEDVVSAKKSLADAQQNEADLAIDTARAFERASRAQEDAAEAAAAAAAGGSVERDLNRRIAEARQRVKDAEAAAASASAGGFSALQDAYKDLNDEGIEFVDTLDRVREQLIEVRKETSGPLFIGLTSALETFEAALPALAPLFEETGSVVGDFADKLSTALLTGEGFETLKSVWGDNNALLGDLGDAAINLALAFLEILDAASPVISAFGAWASSSSANFLKDLRKDGDELTETFENSADRLNQILGVVGTFFSALGVIGGVINKEGGAADTLLEGLQTRATDFLSDMEAGAADGSLETLFQGLADNFLLIFDGVAAIGEALLDIGSQQGIGDLAVSLTNTVETIQELGVALTEGENSPVAGLGKFIELFAELILNLTDSGALTTFFETLNGFLEDAVAFTGSDAFQEFFEDISPIIAEIAALGLIFRSVRGLVEVLFGTLNLLLIPLLKLGIFVTLLGGVKGGGAGGLGGIFVNAIKFASKFLGIAGLVIGVLIGAYQQSEQFREAVAGFFAGVGEAFTNAFGDIQEFFSGGNGIGPKTKEVFDSLIEIGKGILKFIGDLLGTALSIITLVIGAVIGGISGAIQFVVRLFEGIFSLIDGWVNLFKGFIALITGDWEGAIEFFSKALEGFAGFFSNVWDGILLFFKGIVNGFIDAWNGLASKISFNLPEFLGGGKFELPTIPRLAEGGVVYPRTGGILANIAEGGQAERIEPLDPNGLSRRDKAIIDRLSGGGGGATINVYPSQGMNERELAEMVSRKMAYQMRRGSV